MAAAACIAMAATACGSDDGLLGAEGAQEEMREALAETPLPEGEELDLPEPEEGDLHEPGYGTSLVQINAACLWMREWLEARAEGDEAAEREAWEYIDSIPELDYFQNAGPNLREGTLDNIERAELGDPSGIAQHVQANCPRDDE